MKVVWTNHDNTHGIEEHDGELFLVWRQPVKDFFNLITTQRNVHLSTTEKQILSSISKGICNKEISKSINLSVSTVKFHSGKLYRKFGVANRQELMGRIMGNLTIEGSQTIQ